MSRGRRTQLVAIALLACVCIAPAPAGAAPRQRASFTEVEAQLMCVSCREPLAAVQSPQALSEKAYVRTLIAQGDTQQQILEAMVAQYGVAVLAKPPASGFDLTIYILPPAVLVAGLLFLAFTLPRWRNARRGADGAPGAAGAHGAPGGESPPELSPADAARLNEDLARLA